MAGGFSSASDGAVEVDSNTGTPEELQAELASEVAAQDPQGRLISSPQTPAAEGEGEELEEGGEAAAKPVAAVKAGEKPATGKRQSIQARIDAITREKYTTAQERDTARAEAATLRAELAALKAPAAKPGEKPGTGEAAKPAAGVAKAGGVGLDVEKFPKFGEWLAAGNDGELEDWVDARDEWKQAKGAAAAAIETERTEHSRRFTQTAATFNERMAPHLKAEPDFYERIDPRLTETPAMSALPKGVKPAFGNFIVEQVVRSEFPKELMEHLSDPKVIQRLATLQPEDILRSIARFEIGLGAPAAHSAGPAGESADDDDEDDTPRGRAAATETSRAQPPAKPVRGSSHEHSSPDDEPGEDASDDEWYRWENRRIQKQARG